MNTNPRNYHFTLLGSPSVGKSNIASRFYQDSFTDQYDPTLEGTFTKTVLVDGYEFSITLTDTAGQQKFVTLNHIWMHDKQGFIFVFDVTQENTFFEAIARLEDSKRYQEKRKVPCILVGNKIDLELERCVTCYKGQKKADEMNVHYVECSAKERINIMKIFVELVKQNELIRVMESKNNERVKGFFDEVADACEEKCSLI